MVEETPRITPGNRGRQSPERARDRLFVYLVLICVSPDCDRRARGHCCPPQLGLKTVELPVKVEIENINVMGDDK